MMKKQLHIGIIPGMIFLYENGIAQLIDLVLELIKPSYFFFTVSTLFYLLP